MLYNIVECRFDLHKRAFVSSKKRRKNRRLRKPVENRPQKKNVTRARRTQASFARPTDSISPFADRHRCNLQWFTKKM